MPCATDKTFTAPTRHAQAERRWRRLSRNRSSSLRHGGFWIT
ncbi:hypothetical protein [Iodidimonas muriae]|nr:hypothetical protein [Iodidimonas muriae]